MRILCHFERRRLVWDQRAHWSFSTTSVGTCTPNEERLLFLGSVLHSNLQSFGALSVRDRHTSHNEKNDRSSRNFFPKLEDAAVPKPCSTHLTSSE